MCCLFGFVDYGHKLTLKQRNRLLSILATSCEARGTDATGISYNAGNRLKVFKRPLPAHLMWYRVPPETTVVMGHTRMTTQGSEKKNENNHPFLGRTEMGAFALAHNGVLYNDKLLRKARKLPDTRIETDSYVAVQLLEQSGKLDFDSLKNMAEQLEGTFTITALSQQDDLFFVKGNNPLCIFHFPQQGIYIYASTEEILQKALNRARLRLGFCPSTLRERYPGTSLMTAACIRRSPAFWIGRTTSHCPALTPARTMRSRTQPTSGI